MRCSLVEKGKTMKIILDISDDVVAAFLVSVQVDENGGIEMVSHPLDKTDLIDGKETKLPKVGEAND